MSPTFAKEIFAIKVFSDAEKRWKQSSALQLFIYFQQILALYLPKISVCHTFYN